MPAKKTLHVFDLYWSPTGQKIGTVEAPERKAAIRKAPQPYRKYIGEIYAEDRGVKNPAAKIPVGKRIKVNYAIVNRNGTVTLSVPARAKAANPSAGVYGYAVYPGGFAAYTLADAKKIAKQLLRDGEYPVYIDSVRTGKTVWSSGE